MFSATQSHESPTEVEKFSDAYAPVDTPPNREKNACGKPAELNSPLVNGTKASDTDSSYASNPEPACPVRAAALPPKPATFIMHD
jgi:hypothetical protein